MVANTDTEVQNKQYCIRVLPNKTRTYGSANEFFKNIDDTLGSFINCQQENDDGGSPPVI
jgi:hypothetical protein